MSVNRWYLRMSLLADKQMNKLDDKDAGTPLTVDAKTSRQRHIIHIIFF